MHFWLQYDTVVPNRDLCIRYEPSSKMTWMWIYVKSVSFFSMDILTLYNLPPKFSKRGQQKFINPSSCSLMITNNTKCRFWKFEPHYLRQICRMLLLLQDQHRHDVVDGCVWVGSILLFCRDWHSGFPTTSRFVKPRQIRERETS